MSEPYFPSGSLMISCEGAACLQDGTVVHAGVIPSHSVTTFFQPQKRISLLVPEDHHAMLMIKSSHAFCINVLPAHMVHDSLHPAVTSPRYVEAFEDTGLTTTPCSYISCQRFVQAAACIECVVDRYVLLDGFVLIHASMVATNYHDKSLSKLKPVLDTITTQQEA